ncbi:hypothetical protein TCARB_0846 [Thermofilum adornatum 1505]|uniref:Uncharacterized protein n=1 Tax=Thermofilum adornatum 1505 TaxID=697581 RepID=A0A3G1A6U7_9CREN|nr:hypothetical protein TCARB_0846 [Thermofilum adornatum 1505]
MLAETRFRERAPGFTTKLSKDSKEHRKYKYERYDSKYLGG